MGIGTDIHRLEGGPELVLGGVSISFPLGLVGHSDGDVALHALVDALLGAAGMGDIGTLFPDTDEKWKDFDSREFVIIVRNRLQQDEWQVVNVDLTIQAEQPKLGPIKGQIKRSIADLLAINFADVNVKAKTNEGLGDIGQVKAIAALAAVTLKKRIKRTL